MFEEFIQLSVNKLLFLQVISFYRNAEKLNECKGGIPISGFPVSSVVGTRCFGFAPGNTSNTFWKGSNKNKVVIKVLSPVPIPLPKEAATRMKLDEN